MMISTLIAIAVCLADVDDGPGQRRESDAVSAAGAVDALTSMREKLHSGTCSAHWTWTTKTYKEQAECQFYFDYDKGLSRVDRSVMNKHRVVVRIDTPLEVIHYVPRPLGTSTITRLPPNAPALANGQVFDLRTTGLAPLISVKGNAARWKNVLAMLSRDGDAAMQEEPNGDLRLTWHTMREVKTPNGKIYEQSGYVFFLRRNLQFAPVRAEFFAGGSVDANASRPNPRTIIETDWIEREGIVIPARCKWDLPSDGQTAELKFASESVNGSVDDKLFTPQGLGAPNGTYIVNSRLGESFIENILGEKSN